MITKIQNTTGTVYIQTGTKDIKVVSGLNAIVTIAAPLGYNIAGKSSGKISNGRSITLELTYNSTYRIVNGYFDGTVEGNVLSVFGREGDVVSQTGDYNTSQVPENTNLYFTTARVLATLLTGLNTAVSQVIVPTDTILLAMGYLQAQITAIGVAVNSISIATANGFAGSSSGGSTPILTLTTTITGILKGGAGAVTAAIANVDYQAPISFTTTGTSGAATFSGAALNIPVYQAAGSYVPTTRNLTINGSTQDLSADRTFTITTTGTANRITVTGGTGLTPTIDIAATYVGQASITTLGTVATGIWQGTSITSAYGGMDNIVDYSATSTIIGWSSFTEKKITYYSTKYLDFYFINLSGTSDATTASLTIANACTSAIGTTIEGDIALANNGVIQAALGLWVLTPGSSTTQVRFARDVTGTAWTASGTKTVRCTIIIPK